MNLRKRSHNGDVVAFGAAISTAVAVVCAVAVTSCSNANESSTPNSTDELVGSVTKSTPQADAATSSEVLTRPEGLFARLTKNGLTVSWFGVSGATDGYQVAIDGAWQSVDGTKVRYPSIKPGLTYRIQVAAAADGQRGPAATITVGSGRSAKPREIIKTKPQPLGTQPAKPSDSPSDATSVDEDPPTTSTSPTPQGTEPTQADEQTATPSLQNPAILKVSSNGCGFSRQGKANLKVTLVLDGESSLAPSALIDTSGRLYVPTSSSAKDEIIFAPVRTGEPPAGAAIDAALITETETTEGLELPLDPIEWGHQLCDQEVADPRW